MVPLDIEQPATAAPQPAQGLEHKDMMRPGELGPADPGGEQVAQDRQRSDLPRQGPQEVDEPVDHRVPLAQVGVAQKGDGTVGDGDGGPGSTGRRDMGWHPQRRTRSAIPSRRQSSCSFSSRRA